MTKFDPFYLEIPLYKGLLLKRSTLLVLNDEIINPQIVVGRMSVDF